MSELLHTFVTGKMNKDYDDRLVPNGEYRDALNLEITDSDGSNIGALQNIRGNIELTNKSYNISTGVFTPWAAGYIDELVNPICIGRIVDNTTEKLYWLIASDGISAIAEYDQTKDLVIPILVDTQNILNFSKDYLITGINIIEGLLFFTDYQTEPKTLDINAFRALNTTSFLTHTQIYGRNFVEADITVIKKSPLAAPSLTLAASIIGGPGTGVDPVYTSYNIIGKQNFTYVPDPINEPSVYVSMPPFAEVQAGTPQYPIPIGSGVTGIVSIVVNQAPTGWAIDSVIKLKGSAVNDFNQTFEYEVRLLITSIFGTAVTAKILSISQNILIFGSGPIIWECLLEEKQPMFEFKFPRFSYRWKYKNNEFSCISPFTTPAFLGGKFKYLSSDGYNTGMVNNARLISLNNIDWGDESVVEIEILYKESDSAPIYKVDSLKDRLITSFNITSEIIGAMLEPIQLLRPWDNVPRKAKAQEIIGNRLMYGNYYQNYNMNGNVNLSLTESRLIHPGNINSALPNQPPIYVDAGDPFSSIKSIRTYQAGVVYRDAYGRETPVLTNKNASFTVPKTSAAYINRLAITPANFPPTWATHFKYFIKETSTEYYNLALDRFYFGEDGNVWLSFPSSERNKLTEDTYVTIKKQHDNDVAVTEEARYKVLSIKSEAPEFISTFYKNETTVNITPISGFQVGFLTITFTGPSAIVNNTFYSGINSSKYIRISAGGNSTGNYQVETGGPTGSGDTYSIKLKRVLSDDATFLGITSSFTGPLTIDLLSKQPERLAEFEGRFFVKINRDTAFDTNIVRTFRALKKNYGIVAEVLKRGNMATFGTGDSNSWGVFFQNRVSECLRYSLISRSDRQAGAGAGALWNTYYGLPITGSRFISIIKAGMPDRNYWTEYGADFVNISAQVNALVRLVSVDGEVSITPYKIIKYSHGGYNRGIKDWGIDMGCSWGDQYETGGNYMHIASMELDRAIDDPWATSIDNVKGYQIVTEIINDGNRIISSTNPAIFETEPKKTVDLELYYAATDNFPIAEHQDTKILNWYNCYSYGSGVESNRIRDDYNAVTIDKGPVVSSILNIPYAEEIKSTSIIYSGIFNSISGVNNLNQFVQADSIVKNLNPYYGSVQALLARDTDLIAFCEDKILNILANKDALYNADGNSQLTASSNVLGQTTPYVGEFGISKNPESLASYGFRTYFTDRSRGTVIRLSRDGLEPIGDKGMAAFFSDNLPLCSTLIGSFNDSKGSYNLTLSNLTDKWQTLFATGQYDRTNPDCNDYIIEGLVPQTTVTFKENADGWTSRMSFIQETGCSLNSIFYTFKRGAIWMHDRPEETLYSNFYGVQYDCSINVIINESPETVKGFKTLNYTGSRQREYVYYNGDGHNYSIAEIQANGLTPTSFSTKKGWYANYVATDLQEGQVKEFIKKEGKYFNYIKGLNTFFNTNCDNNVNTQEFAVQGIGRASSITGDVTTTGFAIRVFSNDMCCNQWAIDNDIC